MARWFRSRTTWILPLVLSVVALLENIVTYKVDHVVHGVRLRAAIVFALNGIGFGIGAGLVAPALGRVLGKLHRESSDAGTVFTWIFYAMTYGLVFYAYLLMEKYGPGGLLPASWR